MYKTLLLLSQKLQVFLVVAFESERLSMNFGQHCTAKRITDCTNDPPKHFWRFLSKPKRFWGAEKISNIVRGLALFSISLHPTFSFHREHQLGAP